MTKKSVAGAMAKVGGVVAESRKLWPKAYIAASCTVRNLKTNGPGNLYKKMGWPSRPSQETQRPFHLENSIMIYRESI